MAPYRLGIYYIIIQSDHSVNKTCAYGKTGAWKQRRIETFMTTENGTDMPLMYGWKNGRMEKPADGKFYADGTDMPLILPRSTQATYSGRP